MRRRRRRRRRPCGHLEPARTLGKFSDLWYPLPLALVVIMFRHIVEKLVFKPIGIRLGLKDHQRRRPFPHEILEEAFLSRRFSAFGQGEVAKLASACNMAEVQVQRWLRQRRQAELPTTLQKFCETGWRWLFYTSILVYGFVCLWSKPWFWNIR